VRLPFLLAAALAALAPPALAAPDARYLAELGARARELKLAERPEWLKLVHYVPTVAGRGVHSLVDSPQWFNAPDGKANPQAELEATLASFYSEAEETPRQQNPQCLFIARRQWLDGELHFDRSRMPQRDCPRYREWREALNAERLTLVFASAYLNNPSSMYGHTLLRVDARDQNERTRLLAYTINFAADTNETNGLTFAVKGLLGGYAGTFSVLPYYLKVREYTDLENRDLWEYELALAPEEVDRVLSHAWELLSAYFQYFFFDENCSYHLLGLLQVARPELELTPPFRWWALPSDTVRVVTSTPGLVARSVYRPANATIIAGRLKNLTPEERSIAKDLSTGKATSLASARALAPERDAAVLETAFDYAGYRRATGKRDVADPARLARELLVARSEVPAPSQAPQLEPPTPPDQGHRTSRLALGAGRREGRAFQELQWRPVYHDIMDPEPGYVRGAQIEFFDTAIRHFEDGATRLERLTPVDIVSLAPRDEFFQPRSWRIGGGWERMFLRDGREPLVGHVDGGAGATWGNDRALLYAMGEAAFRLHHELEHGYGVGAGARAGALVDLTPRLRIHAYASGLDYFAGEHDTPRAATLQARYGLGRDSALRANLERRREAGREFTTTSISLQFYY
jgi:Domain of unknown function (DUF4105)